MVSNGQRWKSTTLTGCPQNGLRRQLGLGLGIWEAGVRGRHALTPGRDRLAKVVRQVRQVLGLEPCAHVLDGSRINVMRGAVADGSGSDKLAVLRRSTGTCFCRPASPIHSTAFSLVRPGTALSKQRTDPPFCAPRQPFRQIQPPRPHPLPQRALQGDGARSTRA